MGKEISSSSSRAMLTQSYSCKLAVVNWLPLFSFDLEQSLILYLYFLSTCCPPHASSLASQQWWREDPCMGKTSEEGNRPASALGSAWESSGWAATHAYWKSLLLYRPRNSLLGCLQNSTEKREMGRGKKQSEKLLCSQGKKNKQPYLAYPALLMSITFLILNRKDTTLVHLFHYLSCYVFPMNCHSCKPVHRKGTP